MPSFYRFGKFSDFAVYDQGVGDQELGLRELKKQMTRETIADAALQLTLEKGLDNVTIEEIAQQAIVSPRTVSNYFSCKEEAVVAAGMRDSLHLLEDFAARPADEPPLESLREVLMAYVRDRTDEQLQLSAVKMQLAEQYPSLQPFQMARLGVLEGALRDSIARRTGTNLDSDMYPWLVSAAAISAVQTATRMWAHAGAAADTLPALIDEAFSMIVAGLPLPNNHVHATR